MKVKLTVISSKCRSGYHKTGDTFVVGDLCPPICHELWQCMYPNIYTLLNNGTLDYGTEKAKKFSMMCPDNGRVVIEGTVIDE